MSVPLGLRDVPLIGPMLHAGKAEVKCPVPETETPVSAHSGQASVWVTQRAGAHSSYVEAFAQCVGSRRCHAAFCLLQELENPSTEVQQQQLAAIGLLTAALAGAHRGNEGSE